MSYEFSLVIKSAEDHIAPLIDNPVAKNPSSIDDLARFLPLLIATATLLAMVNVKNGDLATRFRNNSKDYRIENSLEKTTDASINRMKNIEWQNRIFFWRYVMTSISFIFLSMSLISFALLSVKQFVADNNCIYDIFKFDNGLKYAAIGIVLLGIEFFVGFVTLLMDGADVKRATLNAKRQRQDRI